MRGHALLLAASLMTATMATGVGSGAPGGIGYGKIQDVGGMPIPKKKSQKKRRKAARGRKR